MNISVHLWQKKQIHCPIFNSFKITKHDAVISFGGRGVTDLKMFAFSRNKGCKLTCIYVHTKKWLSGTDFSKLKFPMNIYEMFEGKDFSVSKTDIYKEQKAIESLSPTHLIQLTEELQKKPVYYVIMKAGSAYGVDGINAVWCDDVIDKKEWQLEEETKLADLVEQHGNKWGIIAESIGRERRGVQEKWNKLLGKAALRASSGK